MVLVMVRLGRAAAAVVSNILPRGVVTVKGTSVSGDGDGARAITFLPFLGGIGRCCIDEMAGMSCCLVIKESRKLVFRCKYWGTRLAPSQSRARFTDLTTTRA